MKIHLSIDSRHRVKGFLSVLALLLFTLAYDVAPGAQAAPCCSGSALVPTLITTDSNAQVAFQAGQSAVVGNSQSDGSSIFNREGNAEHTTAFQLAGAYALSARWQIHASVPFNRRGRTLDEASGSHAGWGDSSAGVALEALQELRYNPYKPRVWIFADLTAPTGNSIYEATDNLKTEAHGRGAWAGTLGAMALKTWGSFDAYVLGEHRRNATQTVSMDGQNTRVTLGPTTAIDGGLGYSISGFRLGASLGPTWDGAVKTSAPSGEIVQARSKLSWSVGMQVAYTFLDTWAFSASYSDQTLVGPSYNAPLSRGFMTTLTKRFE